MFARSSTSPMIMVAPTGARRGKDDHPRLPLSTAEICEETVECAAVGADALHLHVRDAAGVHSLDSGLYQEVITEIRSALPGFPVQVTTESAGLFSVEQQLACLRQLRPKAASISVREIARSPELAPQVYGLCADEGIAVQHILFDLADWQRLSAWHSNGIVRHGQCDVLFVLGAYSPPRAAAPGDLQALASIIAKVSGSFMVCAFGKQELNVLYAAASHCADLRVGFENNIHGRDGRLAISNAANVAALKAALTKAEPEGLSP